jgi:hypothetical protein
MWHTVSPRYEFKLRCESYLLDQVQAWVKLHTAHWCVTYSPRQVNNIYFDTYGHQCLNENMEGVGTRRKLRLRWYGPDLDIVTGAHLELKCRDGEVGWKETCSLDLSAEGDSLTLDLTKQSWSDLLGTIKSVADARANLWLDHFTCPVLVNHYQRAYYATADQTVRLTIDSKLWGFDQRFSARPNLRRPSPIADCVIVEIKADCEHYARMANLLGDFPVRISRNSKYVQGMLAAPDFDGVGPL